MIPRPWALKSILARETYGDKFAKQNLTMSLPSIDTGSDNEFTQKAGRHSKGPSQNGLGKSETMPA